MSKAWSADWKSRVRDRARQIGFGDLWTCARAHPGAPFGQLFQLLRDTEEPNDTPIAYTQFQSVFFDDANSHGKVQDAVMDTLVRRLRQHLIRGWNIGKRNKEQKAEVIAQWEVPPEQFELYSQIRNKVWGRLKEMPIPDNWCPDDINDPVIQAVFARAWPIEDAASEP